MKKVSNEVSLLRKVVVHRPDDGLERVTPSRALDFLYDDITYLPEMQAEHDVFTNTIRAVLGEDSVVETVDLLLDVLRKKPEAKKELIDAVAHHENISDELKEQISHLSAKDLNYLMFNGVNPKTKEEIMPPLPNYVFTRDIGVVINDHLLICQAAKKARSRENLISSTIFRYHKEFRDFWSDQKIINLTEEAKEITVEGGDVMVIDKDYVLVGQSERTTKESIDKLAELLFEKEVIENVVRVEIPDTRSYMHIDTVFTQISSTEFVVYTQLMEDPEKVKLTVINKSGKETVYPTLSSFLHSINPDIKLISCGNGNDANAEREQWTDGCNLVALKSGLAIAYRRNIKTADALQDYGYTIMKAETFLKLYREGDLKVEDLGKFIFTIPSAELSRARGGPHCMTFPIHRD